jgi:dolichyl-phosphate beta-glucosyltransferase
MIKSLSIIFPVFNEEFRLKSSFNHILNFFKKKKNLKIEIIFVDDGSKDNSYNLITQFIQNFKTNNRIKIKVIKSKRNLGKGSALKLGVKKAKHDWILTTDIDMSVSLFQFLNWMKKKLIHKKYFVYFGSRTHKESIVKKNIFRNMLGNVMTFCISAVLNIKIKDTQCGYKLYKKKVARLIFSKLKNCGFEHDVELVLLLKSKQIKIRELPVKWVHKSSSSLNILWDPVKMLVGIFLLKFRKF